MLARCSPDPSRPVRQVSEYSFLAGSGEARQKVTQAV
jgi:hypothetical protein